MKTSRIAPQLAITAAESEVQPRGVNPVPQKLQRRRGFYLDIPGAAQDLREIGQRQLFFV
jgi:hypothetical protein